MFKTILTIVIFFGLIVSSFAIEQTEKLGLREQTNIADYLQSISVTIKAKKGFSESQGSGVIVTRELRKTKGSVEKTKVNFIWTAAHVVRGLRNVRTVIDPLTGTSRKVVEFKDAQLVQELTQNGRKVGEVKMEARVLKYSDATDGEDLALLIVRKTGFVDVSAQFYLEDKLIPIGTSLFHVGSLLGQVGANSMTQGIMSQQGRVLQIGNGEGVVFDQTTVTAFPGSSGGGVFLSGLGNDNLKSEQGKYIGMLVRGSGEGFNFIVPIRRMKRWAERVNIQWALDPAVQTPLLDELMAEKIEDSGVDFDTRKLENPNKSINDFNYRNNLHFLIANRAIYPWTKEENVIDIGFDWSLPSPPPGL